jgi:hypothetical protein
MKKRNAKQMTSKNVYTTLWHFVNTTLWHLLNIGYSKGRKSLKTTDFSKNKKSVPRQRRGSTCLNSNQERTSIKEKTMNSAYQRRTAVKIVPAIVNYSAGGLYGAGLNRMNEGGR